MLLLLKATVLVSCALALFESLVYADHIHPKHIHLSKRNLLKIRQDAVASKNDSSSGGGGTTIDFLLSNYWNSTQYLAQSNPNVTFVTNGNFSDTGQNSTDTQPTIVSITVEERRQYQRMVGLGAGLTDATAIILQELKSRYPDAYAEILNLCFNESPEWIAKGGAGMNMLRLPIGASDFGFTEYTYDDTVDGSPDPTLSQFNLAKSPRRWQTVQDILEINPGIIIMASPWSQPAWMKGNTKGSLRGGSVLEKYEDVFGDYLVKYVTEMKKQYNININMLSLQNEPLYDKAVYPCTLMKADQQARIGTLVRDKLDKAGLTDVGLLAYDHNWDQSQYPIDVFDDAAESFEGVAWHCYGGNPSGQDPFNAAYPNKKVWFTECTRITQYANEPWGNIKKQFDTLIQGSISHQSETMILWNLALQVDKEGFTTPSLPQTCKNCLAPILVFANSTADKLPGTNDTAIQQQKSASPSKRDVVDALLTSFDGMLKRQDVSGNGVVDAKKTNVENMNKGSANEGQVIPAARPNYYRTSDFVTLAHLGTAIRPASGSNRWARRVGVLTSDDSFEGPRVKAQLFRNPLGNGKSRWSLILLQQYDHYEYDKAVAEDITFQIKFRNAVATIILPPGAFTLQWTVEDSKFEKPS